MKLKARPGLAIRDGEAGIDLGEAGRVRLRPVRDGEERRLRAAVYPDRPEADFAAQWRRLRVWQAAGTGLWLVADAGGDLVGAGQLLPWPGGAELANLAVTPGWRGQGLGTALVRHLAAAAADRGYEQLEVAVARDNERARALYQRLGFRSAGADGAPGRPFILLAARPTWISNRMGPA